MSRAILRDARIAIRRGRQPAGRHTATLRQAWEEWQRLAEAGVARPRSGQTYKPAALRAYERALRLRVFPAFGDEPVGDLSRADWQGLADDLLARGCSPSTVQMTIAAASTLYRHACSRGLLRENPTLRLELPVPSGSRDRIAGPEEAAALLAALPAEQRAIWATAMYAGLRRGELQALRVSEVGLEQGVIHVAFGWDEKVGRIATKGRTQRRVPIPAALRSLLAAELLRSGRRDDELLFANAKGSPFQPGFITRHADAAWKAAGLARITLHECRHTYASLMIAAGVNAKALSAYMGHSSIQITFDRYGHLMPGNEAEAGALLDAYLGGAAAG